MATELGRKEKVTALPCCCGRNRSGQKSPLSNAMEEGESAFTVLEHRLQDLAAGMGRMKERLAELQ